MFWYLIKYIFYWFFSNKAYLDNPKFFPVYPYVMYKYYFFVCILTWKSLWNIILGRGTYICKGLDLREHDFQENCKQCNTSGKCGISGGAAVKGKDI